MWVDRGADRRKGVVTAVALSQLLQYLNKRIHTVVSVAKKSLFCC
jgi:hypothetical protein